MTSKLRRRARGTWADGLVHHGLNAAEFTIEAITPWAKAGLAVFVVSGLLGV